MDAAQRSKAAGGRPDAAALDHAQLASDFRPHYDRARVPETGCAHADLHRVGDCHRAACRLVGRAPPSNWRTAPARASAVCSTRPSATPPRLIIALMAMPPGPLPGGEGVADRVDHRQHPAGAGRVRAGRRRQIQDIRNSTSTGARAQATLMTLAAIALIVPAGFHYLAGPAGRRSRRRVSAWRSRIVLLVTYGLHLLFSLHTHKQLFAGRARARTAEEQQHVWTVRRSVADPGRSHRRACLDERDPGGLAWNPRRRPSA